MNKYLSAFIAIACIFGAQLSHAGKALHVVYTYGQASMGNILQTFEASTGIPINVEFFEQNDFKSELMTSIDINKAPDAIIVPADHVGLYNFIQYSEVDPHLFKTKINPRIWQSGMSDGKIYGAPLIQGNHLMLYYNKSLIKEPAHDWDQMLAQKDELDAKGIATIAWSYDEPFWFLPFLGAFGGWPLNEGKIDLNSPAMIAALEFYRDLRVKKLPYPSCDHSCSTDLFTKSKVAYTINGEWEGTHFFKALGDNLGVSAIPRALGKKMLPTFSTYVIAFPNDSLNSAKRENLIRLVNYLQSTKVQQQLWEITGAIPVEDTAFKNAQKNAKGYLKETLALMVDTKAIPSDQAMSFIWDAMGKGFIRRSEGGMDSKSAALFMQQLAERNLRNAKQQLLNNAEKDTP